MPLSENHAGSGELVFTLRVLSEMLQETLLALRELKRSIVLRHERE